MESGGLCPKERVVSVQGASLSKGGSLFGGVSVKRRESPSVDRQTPVKTLPSLAVGKNECRCSLWYDIHNFLSLYIFKQKTRKTNFLLKPKYFFMLFIILILQGI